MYKNIKTLYDVDILVIGAGSAGSIAAIAAASAKKYTVLLIERYGFPGGTSTQMLDTFYGFFTPGQAPVKIVGGLPDKVVSRLDDLGEIFLRPNTYGAGTGINYNPERLKNVWDDLLLQSGVRLLLHTTLIDVNRKSNGNYECILWNKSGFYTVTPKRVIDASGDADFCDHAGFDCETAGELEPAQSMTTTFRMANVDLKAYEEGGGKRMLAERMASTTHPLPRKEGSAHAMNVKNCISTIAVKVAGLSALKADELTAAEVEGRRQAFVFEKFFQQEVPGYAHSKIIGLSNQIGIRETRRVYGEHRLTREECMAAAVGHDSILLCGAPIEDHRGGRNGEAETVWQYIPHSGVYGVPYGTIVPKGSEVVWVIGRCFSATHDAHASCRSMGQTMAMGHAAGLAAVQSLDKDEAAGNLDIQALRATLNQQGAVLEAPEEQAFTGTDQWKLNITAHAFL